MKKFLIIAAGGSGNRMKSKVPKQFLLLAAKPALMHSVEVFYNYDKNISIIIALPENQISEWKTLCKKHKFNIPHQIVKGGETRFHSVRNGLSLITENGIVAVHDAARPLVNQKTIAACFGTASKQGNAIPVVKLNDSIREINGNKNFFVDRNNYRLIQTPQCFQTKILKKAYQQSYDEKFTDDASIVETMGEKINLVEGNIENIKITTAVDLLIAEGLISSL